MARISVRCILCFFAPLAFLSGCQQIPFFGGLVCTETKKSDVVVASKSASVQPIRTEATPIQSPAASVEAGPPGSVFDSAFVKTLEPKKQSAEGVLGTAVFEPGPEAAVALISSSQNAAQPEKSGRKFDPVVLAFQAMLDGKHQEALVQLQTYDKSTQEFFLNWMPAAAIILRTPIDQMSAQEYVMLNELFTRWSQTIRNHTELVISNMCYCRSIRGFGDYDPLPANHAFLSGTAGRYGELVQVYVELKNFVSEKVKDDDYVTKLACSLEIKDSAGKRVPGGFFEFKREETTHRSRSRLNDLHKNFSFNVPAIPPGTYRLTIQVVDATLPSHRRVAQQSLDFRVTPVATDVPQR